MNEGLVIKWGPKRIGTYLKTEQDLSFQNSVFEKINTMDTVQTNGNILRLKVYTSQIYNY
jgi:hypothetical protein